MKRVAAVLLAVATMCGAGRAGLAGPPSTVIDGLNATFLEIMKNGPGLGFAGRYKTLEPVLDAAFDFPDMTRISAGRYWKDMTEEQRTRLVAAFRSYSLSTYAARFDDFGGETFEILGEQAEQQDSVRVNSQIVTGDGEAIRVDYLLQPDQDNFRIIDIYLKASISELAVRRSEFGSVLSKKGTDGLIAALEDKAAELAKEGQ
jgi:phospholipid transport system substrate-binding protein